jgi:hypothetical protein
MFKLNELGPQDRKLLEDIEEILVVGNIEQREDQSFLSFCAHLASAVPEVDTGFQEQVYEKLTARYNQKYSDQTETITSREKPAARYISFVQHLVQATFGIGRIFQPIGSRTTAKGFILIALVTLAIGSLTVAFVPSVQAAIVDAYNRIVLGQNTFILQVDPDVDVAPRTVPPDFWKIRTEIGNFAGNAPHGVKPIVQSVNSFEEAQVLTDFHLLNPFELPTGYSLREVKLAPLGSTFWVILFYEGAGHEIIIAQMPGGPQFINDPTVASSVVTGVLTDGTLEEVDFYGKPAVWIEGHSLLWEYNGISYEVGGLDLDIQQVMNIARSMR